WAGCGCPAPCSSARWAATGRGSPKRSIPSTISRAGRRSRSPRTCAPGSRRATPDVPGGVRPAGDDNPIAHIDLSPLEFLSRSVTVRLLYASPTVGDEWKRLIRRKRVRLWTQEGPVMAGWRRQVDPALPPERQDNLWRWVRDNVDFRVRAGRIF